jgi:hypothetical protein
VDHQRLVRRLGKLAPQALQQALSVLQEMFAPSLGCYLRRPRPLPRRTPVSHNGLLDARKAVGSVPHRASGSCSVDIGAEGHAA